MLNPYLGMALIAFMLGGLMFGLRNLQRRFELHPEVVRKLLHVIMGLVTLNLIWIFSESWPVVTLAIATVIVLFLLRRSRLKKNLGQVLHAVNRASLGELAFPLAVATVFILANNNYLLYCIPILVLTLSDATAALIGLRYGTLKYQAAEGFKSIEGSLTFWIVTFNSVLLVLLIFSQVGRIESILIAFILGLLVMMLEAVSWQGLDNLFIPLGSFLLLNTFLDMTSAQLVNQLIFIFGLLVIILLWRQPTAFDSTAIMTAAVIGYLIWATGGWIWLLAPITLFLTYSLVLPKKTEVVFTQTSIEEPSFITKEVPFTNYTVYTVVSATASGLMWLLFADTLKMPELILPYMLSFTIYLAIIGASRIDNEMPLKTRFSLFWQSVFFAWCLIPLPFYLFQGFTLNTLLILACTLAATTMATWIFYYIHPSFRDQPTEMERWRWQGGLTGVCSMLGLLPLIL